MILKDLKKLRRSNLELKKPFLPTIILLLVIIIGTMGYNIIWEDTESTVIDELYMTLITITTIGFEEVYPLDSIGRIFTIFVGIFGIGSLFYILSVLMENLVIIQLANLRGKKKMMKKIDKLENHILLIGYGRVGRIAAKELKEHGEKFVIIDWDFGDNMSELVGEDILALEGDGTEDNILLQAGIERARGVIVTTARPSTTVFVVLSAKVLNPNLFIVARSDEESAIEKLQRAGADRIVNPYSIGGQRLARVMVNPNMFDFIESSLGPGENALNLEKIMVPASSRLIGKSLKELDIRSASGATILAVIRDGTPTINPQDDFRIEERDQLIALGNNEQLKRLEELTLGEVTQEYK
ncbi:MAG: potassium channel family protein [Candidatus Kapaibacterium sp.]